MTSDPRSSDTSTDEPAPGATSGGDPSLGPVLSERERAMLEFEGTWWMHDDDRNAMIRARFQCSAEDYYRELNLLLDHPAALSCDPLVVRRLRRQRERRRRARIDGTATGEQGGVNA